MATDWGAFVQGLAHTAPQMGMQVYALRQRDEALARQEKQLQEQLKKQERDSDLRAVDSYFKVMGNDAYADELRVNASNSVAKIFKKWDLGDVPEIKEWDTSYKQYATKLSKTSEAYLKGEMPAKVALENVNALYKEAKNKREREMADKERQNIATESLVRKEGTEEEQLRAKTMVPKDTRDALGLTEEKKPYKVGQILPNQIVGDSTVSLQVTGFDEEGMPTFRQVGGGPRYKPTVEGAETPAEKKAKKEEEAAYKTAASGVSGYIAKTKEDRAKWYTALGKSKKGSEDEKKITAELENFDTQLEKAQATLDGLRNKEIDPKTVKFGNPKSTGTATGKVTSVLKTDLMKNGYTEKQADKYIEDAKAAGKM